MLDGVFLAGTPYYVPKVLALGSASNMMWRNLDFKATDNYLFNMALFAIVDVQQQYVGDNQTHHSTITFTRYAVNSRRNLESLVIPSSSHYYLLDNTTIPRCSYLAEFVFMPCHAPKFCVVMYPSVCNNVHPFP